MGADSLRLKLISEIMKMEGKEGIPKLKAALKVLQEESHEELIQRLSKPMRKKTDIEEIAKEQNWKPIDIEEFERLIKELDIQEPIEDLIAMI